MRTITYNPNASLNGKACKGEKNIRYELLSPCLVISCRYPDDTIQLEIDDSMPNCSKCIRVFIQCDADCATCPKPEIIEHIVCFPDDDGGCPKCFKPDGTGKCIPKCDRKCDPETGDCVTCTDSDPCPKNQLCVQGQCVCPTGQVKDENGNCVTCISGTIDPNNKCIICVGGKWVPKLCPDGKCNPKTGGCDTCLDNGDCGSGQICTPNGCICNPETHVYNPITEECTPKPECDYTDVDPTGCKICIGGKWVQKPDGNGIVYIKDANGNCIGKPECNCSDKESCFEKGSACVKKQGSTKCYCNDCANKYCDSLNPCGEGCICVGTLCILKPCDDSPCVNGLSCGENCGCSKTTKLCVSCEEDPTALGCEDDGSCDNKPCYEGCPQNCTCGDTVNCIHCSNYSCATSPCPPNCICVGDVCAGNPNGCKDELVSKKDCALEVKLQSEGCPCPLIVPRAFLNSFSKSPQVPPQDTENLPNVRNVVYEHYVELTKLISGFSNNGWNNVKQLPRLDKHKEFELISQDEQPTNGVITLKVTTYRKNQRYNPAINSWINEEDTIQTTTHDRSIANKAFVSFKTGLEDFTTDWVTINSTRYKTIKYEFEFLLTGLIFPNKCTYNNQFLNKIVVSNDSIYNTMVNTLFSINSVGLFDTYFNTNGNYDLSTNYHSFNNIYSGDVRNPLVIWYRSEDNDYAKEDIIRKLYLPKANNQYLDKLYGPKAWYDLTKVNDYPNITKPILISPEGRLLGDMYYQFKTDCQCGTVGIFDFGKVTVCEKELITNYTFENCNKRFKLNTILPPKCELNKDLDHYTASELEPIYKYGGIKSKQAIFKLYLTTVNGVTEIVTLRDKNNNMVNVIDNSLINGSVYNSADAITSVELKMFYGNSTEVVCTQKIDAPKVPDFELQYTESCVNGKGQIVIPPTIGMFAITGIMEIASPGQTKFDLNSATRTISSKTTQATTGTIKVSYNYGGSLCDKEFVVTVKSCCPNLDGITIAPTNNYGIAVSGVPNGVTITYSSKTNLSQWGTITIINGSGNVSNLPSGTYTVTAKYYDTSCVKNFEGIQITASDVYLTLTPSAQAVRIGTSPTPIVAQASNNMSGGLLKYSENNIVKTKLLDGTAKTILTPVAQVDTTFVIISITKNGEEIPISGTATVDFYDIPMAQIISGPSTITAGQSVNIVIEGTEGATVTLNTGQSVVLTMGQTIVAYTPTITSGSETVVITSVTIGAITGTFSGSHVITVNQAIVVNLVSSNCNESLQRIFNFSTSPSTSGSWVVKSTDSFGPTLGTGTGVGYSIIVNTNISQIFLRFTSNSGVIVENTYPVSSCLCPELEFNVTINPDTVCEYGNVTFTVGTVIGGSGNYNYRFTKDGVSTGWLISNYKEYFINNDNPITIDVKDVSSNCITTTTAAPVRIIPENRYIIMDNPDYEINNNELTICDNESSTITFELNDTSNITSYNWSISNYSGISTGTLQSFTINSDNFTTDNSVLTLMYTSIGGCELTEYVNITINDCENLLDQSVLVTRTGNVVTAIPIISTTTFGTPVDLFSDGPGRLNQITLRPDGLLIGSDGGYMSEFRIYDLNTPLPPVSSIPSTTRTDYALGAISNNLLVYIKFGSQGIVYTYNLNTNTETVLVDLKDYLLGYWNGNGVLVVSEDEIWIGASCSQPTPMKKIFKLELSGGVVTNVIVYDFVAGSNVPEGFAAYGSNVYAFVDNKIYLFNLTNPSISSHVYTLPFMVLDATGKHFSNL